MIVDDSSRASAVTSCGIVKTNYAYNGTYGFIHQFGGASLYVYKNSRNGKYQVYSRSWFPPEKLLPVKKITHDRGFLLFEEFDFHKIVKVFHALTFLLMSDLSSTEDFSELPFTNKDSEELFSSEL